MKKDRNCGSYPVYPQMVPNFGGPVMPGQVIPMPQQTPYMTGSNVSNNSNEISMLNNRINNLEQRVTNLENMVKPYSSNNYNTSNYQMM